MNHCHINQKLIWLAIYDELAIEQRHDLEDHLQTCSECQALFDESQRTKEILDHKTQLIPTRTQVEASRAELHQRLLLLSQARFQKKWYHKAWQILSLDVAPAWRLGAAMAILLVGILIGNIFSRRSSHAETLVPNQISELLASNISAIKSIQYNPTTRQVAIELNLLKDVMIQGDIEKPEIQQLLAHSAVNEERPNIRLSSVRALEQTRKLNDNSIRALSELIDKEENPGIRLKAVKLLASIPITPSIKELLAQVLVRVLLTDSNSAIRIEAFKGLSKINDGSMMPVLLNAARQDSSDFIQAKTKQWLDQRENPVFP